MSAVLLALDQGTSSTRCVAFDAELRELGRGAVPVACSYPAAGHVEQDPARLVASAVEAIALALAAAGVAREDVAALSIANQTETFVVWERASGRPIHPAIVWQDRRSSAACDELASAGHEALVRGRTGLELDATFPASKIRWLLDHVPGAARAAEAGELAYGDVASWLVHSLTAGDVHVTDTGNAGRTMLCALGGTTWDPELLDAVRRPGVAPAADRRLRRRSSARPATICRSSASSAINRRRSSGSAASRRGRPRSRSARAGSCSCRPARRCRGHPPASSRVPPGGARA